MNVQNLETATDPIVVFREWLREAEMSEPNDANAAALATAGPNGTPSVRIVLVKKVDQRGFCFYTNSRSRKGMELAANPKAALCFHWKSLRRQVRVEGSVVELPGDDADVYFHSRGRESQLGSAVSQQSRTLASREVMERMVAEFAAKHPGEIPRPEWWKGYAVRPERVELWVDGAHRLHDRFLFTRSKTGWTKMRLYP